ncbi:restriction endonuclease subunit S [Ottowia testudinis]|uniref:Restriction endonuclease subunit S n=1 Tax=Ottowia testudinis TaxID=2816950 RepID=A0A975CIS3_9BURK|nr:restriction endonuclease subunit S [Ottowia testudinis]QTD45727.1 restriction endonuclease subunit S [Ottowia testudinis]
MSSKRKDTAAKEEPNSSLAPNLRFPEFQSAGDWTTVKLGEVATIRTEKVGQNTCVPMSITSGVGLVSQAEKFGRVIAGDSYKNYLLLKPYDFAYNKSATKEYPEGFLALYSGAALAAVPNSIFTCFRVNGDSPDVGFLSYQFSDNLHGRWLRKFIQVGARAHGSLSISDNDLMALPVPVPAGTNSVLEQQKIADCLSTVDELIAAQARKVDALKTHKKGLMQQLFPREDETQPRTRFPEFQYAARWEVQPMEKLAKRGSGHTPSKSHPEYYDGGIKWVSLADSKRLDAGLISKTETEISAQGIDKSSAVLHPAGTVLISRDAGVGKSAVMVEPMAVSQHFIVWTCHADLLSNWFLYYQLQEMKPIFERIATGSTIKTIGLSFFKDMCISLPGVAEQERIASCLSSLDTLIATQAQKLETLKTHKKGLMQQLFPSPEALAT